MSDGSADFRARAAAALHDKRLQRALTNVPAGFIAKRRKAVARLPEFPALMRQVAAMRRQALASLGVLLPRFIAQAEAAGATVHLAADAAEARAIILRILQERGARLVVKGKSMTAEEIRLNPALEAAGMEVVETDLGEYIIQLRKEAPSHIVAPAIHLTAEQIADDFRRAHGRLPPQRPLLSAEALAAEARAVLREKFLAADAGITGANALVAESGSVMLITNEGNGDLCATNPKLHIVVAGVEKLVPDWWAALDVVRVLPRSATGQEITVYATFHTGVKRASEPDGPEETHIVLLANDRERLLAGPFAEMLACIRCGACLNHCPVYQLTGGHAYGRVYSGPMGIVLGRAVFDLEGGGLLADGVEEACTLCDRCAEVCPAGIDLPMLIRRWRAQAVAAGKAGALARAGQRLHMALAARPKWYRRAAGAGARVLRALRKRPRLARRVPGLREWTAAGRALPATAGATFLERHAGKTFPAEEGRTETPPSLPLPPGREEGKKGATSHAIPQIDEPMIPARARVVGAEAVARFIAFSEEAGAPVHRVASPDEAAAVMARVLDEAGLKREVFAHPSLGWTANDLARLDTFSSDAPAALMPALAGVAETGTLLFSSGPQTPARAHLLPEVLFAWLEEDAIVGSYEAALDLLCHAGLFLRHAGESRHPVPPTHERAARDPGFRQGDEKKKEEGEAPALPRSILFVTGPSRTADVEQTLVLGAHGPRAVHVLLHVPSTET